MDKLTKGQKLVPFCYTYDINTFKHLYLAAIFIWHYWRNKQNSPKYETANYSFEIGYTIRNTCTHILSTSVLMIAYVSTSSKPRLKWATIKGKNMLPIGSVFTPLKVALMTIKITLKGIEQSIHQN